MSLRTSTQVYDTFLKWTKRKQILSYAY